MYGLSVRLRVNAALPVSRGCTNDGVYNFKAKRKLTTTTLLCKIIIIIIGLMAGT